MTKPGRQNDGRVFYFVGIVDDCGTLLMAMVPDVPEWMPARSKVMLPETKFVLAVSEFDLAVAKSMFVVPKSDLPVAKSILPLAKTVLANGELMQVVG